MSVEDLLASRRADRRRACPAEATAPWIRSTPNIFWNFETYLLFSRLFHYFACLDRGATKLDCAIDKFDSISFHVGNTDI